MMVQSIALLERPLVETLSDRFVWSGLLWTVGLSSMAAGLVTTPFFQLNTVNPTSQGGGTATLELIIRAATAVIVALSVLALLAGREQPMYRTGFWLLLATLTFAAGPLMSMFMGTVPSVQLGLLRLPIIAVAVYLLPAVDLRWFAARARWVISIYAWATLVMLIVRPGQVLERGYTYGIVPGLDVRLHGIGGHANNFAALLMVWLILGWIDHADSLLARVNWVVIVECLVLTQSKTVWAATLVAYVIHFAYQRGMQAYISLTGLALGLTATALAISLYFPGSLEDAATLSVGQGNSGFSGRVTVWSYTADIWRQNPLFGYGPNLWDTAMGLRFAAIYGWVPPHAHSQFFQTLGESGLVGVAGLVLFATVAFAYAVRTAQATRGATLALVVTLAIRSFSEPSLRASVGENLLIILIVLGTLMLAARRNESPALSRRGGRAQTGLPLPAPR